MVAKTSHHASTARERLSHISHHFLSDDQPVASPVVTHTSRETANKLHEQVKQPYVLPILMGMQENYFPVYALSQALLAHKKSSAVLLVEGELSASSCCTVYKPSINNVQDQETSQGPSYQNPFQQLLEQTGQQHTPDICLIPVAGVTSPYVASSQRILVPVQASLVAIRNAYLHLKRLTGLKQDIAIGIIMLKTDDSAWAGRCFNKLATAAQTFLDMKITSYGYLPDMACPEPLTAQLMNNKQGLPHEMMQIADMILFDLEHHQQHSQEKAPDEIENTSMVSFP